MAAKQALQLVILDGPGLLEFQFADYDPGGHVVTFIVDSQRCLAPGEFREKRSWTLCARVTGSDRVECVMHDPLGRQIPGSARHVRITHNGVFKFKGWFDPRDRKGFLEECGKLRMNLRS